MLVALLVGAIRSQADTSFDPLRMLESLNRRLCGRAEAHATCLALRIAESGAVNLANAGHLPPYLNATELPMEGALLLGMIEDAEFSVLHFQLQPGDRLTFISDGIVEAQDAQGQLFGFERIQEMLHTAPSQKPVSAADLATAAQRFGQQDDISVLTVLRAGPAGVETPIRMESAMSGPFPFGSELA
jgi:serine phosphatase RsbU (regulator of sigma subunit)